MLSRMPLGPTLALKIIVCNVGWADDGPDMLLFGENMVVRGVSRLRELIPASLLDRLASELHEFVPFEISCISVRNTSLASTLLSVVVDLPEYVLVST